MIYFLAFVAAIAGFLFGYDEGVIAVARASLDKDFPMGPLVGGFMTAAALLGVDTCPMEGLDPAQYDEILGLRAQGYATVCACAVGYRSAEDKYAAAPKVRYPLDQVIEHR